MRPPPAPQQNELSRLRRHLDERAAEQLEDPPRGVVLAVVAPEVAGIVVGDR